jgi:class 3 adenylate cyclase
MRNTAVGPPPIGILIPVGSKLWNDKERYWVRQDRTIIGRGPDCHVRINHPTVSRIHAELTWSNTRLILAHLSPVNPTLVNGVPVGEPCPLDPGDLIEIAEGIVLRLELFNSDENAATEPRVLDTRRMYAILHADVSGYSRLVEDNDVATARQIEACIRIIRQQTERADGRVITVSGDGILVLFGSALSAVTSAMIVQRDIATLNRPLPASRWMQFRVGINSGDILITPAGAMHGDAINVAARIQALAPPGGIVVSGAIHDQLQAYDYLQFEHFDTKILRNLSREVRLYRVNVL